MDSQEIWGPSSRGGPLITSVNPGEELQETQTAANAHWYAGTEASEATLPSGADLSNFSNIFQALGLPSPYGDEEEEHTNAGLTGPGVPPPFDGPRQASPAPSIQRSRKQHAKGRGISGKLVMGAVVLAVLLGGVLVFGQQKRKKITRMPHTLLPPVVPAEENYQYTLDLSISQLEYAWDSSSDTVKQAFAKHYAPHKTSSTCPLTLFQRHVAAVHEAAEGWRQSGRSIYIMNCRLVTAIVRAATARLVGLQQLELLCHKTGSGSILLDIEGPQLPSSSKLKKQQEDLVTFRDFITLLQGFPIDVPEQVDEEGQGPGVPRVLAQRLAQLLLKASMQSYHDEGVASHFADFVKTSGSAVEVALPISQGQTPFPVLELSRALVDVGQKRNTRFISPKAVANWAQIWDIDGVKERAAVLLGIERARPTAEEDLKMQILRDWEEFIGAPLPGDDLFSLAIALL